MRFPQVLFGGFKNEFTIVYFGKGNKKAQNKRGKIFSPLLL